MNISPQKLAQALAERGLSDEQIYNFVAIVRGESGYRFAAQNPRGADDSWGLFQINFTEEAGGKGRAKALGIPTKANGLPTKAGLAKYFGLKRNSNGTYSVAKGVSEDELITKNLDALEAMWNRKNYGAWSVHPDNKAFTKDSGEITAEMKKERWEENTAFTNEALLEEYGDFAFQSDDSTGPSARELELEEEFLANKGDPDRQQEIREEILEERQRVTAEGGGSLTPEEAQRRENERLEFEENQGLNENDSIDTSIVPDDPANWDEAIRLPSVLTQEMVDALYSMYGGADYFLGREDMRIFIGVDGKEIKPTVVNGYTIEPGMNALLYAQAMGYEEEDQVRAVLEQTKWYQTRGATARTFDVTWHELGGAGWEDGDPWSQDQIDYLDNKSDELTLMASRLGLDIEDPAVRNMLRDMSYRSMRLGMDKRDEKVEFMTALTEGLDPDRTPGLLESFEGTVESYERKWMVDLGEAVTSDLAKELYYGDIDETVLNEQFKEQSINMYPSLRNLIESGYTPQSYFAPFKQKGEAILERPLDFMGGDNDLFIQLATGGPGEAGLQNPMALAQAGDYFRNRDEWRYTKNANDLSYDMAEQVITMFGGLGGQARTSGGYDSFSSFGNMR